MLAPQDFWDPNTWVEPEPCRIYGDVQCQTFGLVSPEDYPWVVQWRWCWKHDLPTGKSYLRRAIGENQNGMRLRTWTLYLHMAVAKRANLPRLTPYHKILDHRDGDSTNNTRKNLRFVTVSMNNRNRYGQSWKDLLEG